MGHTYNVALSVTNIDIPDFRRTAYELNGISFPNPVTKGDYLAIGTNHKGKVLVWAEVYAVVHMVGKPQNSQISARTVLSNYEVLQLEKLIDDLRKEANEEVASDLVGFIGAKTDSFI